METGDSKTEETKPKEPSNLSERVEFIFSKIQSSYTYWSAKKAIKEEIVKTKYNPSELLSSLPKIVREIEADIKIKNKVNEVYSSMLSQDLNNDFAIALVNGLDASRPIPELPQYFTQFYFEPLESVASSRVEWTQYLRSRMLTIAYDVDKPLLRPRSEQWLYALPKSAPEDREDEDRFESKKDSDIPCVFDSMAFLNAILAINNGNYKEELFEWGSVKLRLKVPSMDAIRTEYEELEVNYKQIGLDEDRVFIEERSSLAEKLLKKDYVPYLTQFAKRGVPPGIRAKVYSKVLDVSSKDYSYFDYLLSQVQKWELSIDKILQIDVQECCDDEKYFIFEEYLEKLVMCFMRDPAVFENLKSLPNLPLTGIASNGKPVGSIPPCTVIPCQHFSRLAAPFTYICDRPEESYLIFRNFYCKYLCYLHSLTSQDKGIISLCRLFENTLQAYDPDLVFHLTQLEINPLKIAFPWLFYSFVGTLEVDQVFLLWDRIIGYDSLDILALMAVALFIYRGDMIMQSTTEEEIQDLFYELSHVKVVPILQHFLFVDKHIV